MRTSKCKRQQTHNMTSICQLIPSRRSAPCRCILQQSILPACSELRGPSGKFVQCIQKGSKPQRPGHAFKPARLQHDRGRLTEHTTTPLCNGSHCPHYIVAHLAASRLSAAGTRDAKAAASLMHRRQLLSDMAGPSANEAHRGMTQPISNLPVTSHDA